ncbi:MAG: sigma-70 family RNA polymerase sigma factor [Treponema sp.]|uniref:sigma-70 family RNA polymerase sigma factor n=1 Tax=Treponema sp. TaxID=166 RepID=UPI003FA2EC71
MMEKTQRTNADNNVFATYLREINKIPLLSAEDELKYAKAAAAGDEKSRKILIESNLRFVVNVAKQYQNKNIPIMDLISEGNIGLMNAADRFDPDKGYKFISYAVWWIRQAILKAICEKSRMIRLPLNRANELVQIEKARKLIGKSGMEGEAQELNTIAKELKIEPDMVETIMNAARDPVSLDAPVFNDNSTASAGDFIEDTRYMQPESYALDIDLRENIDTMLALLTEREAEILRYRFGLNGYEQLSLKEVGNKFNLTKERIRQIEKKALEQLQSIGKQYELESFVA